MSVLSKYNKGPRFAFQFDEKKDYRYEKLSELNLKDEYIIMAMYINDKGDYDDHPVFVTCPKNDQEDIFMCDIPAHLTETVREMIKDDEIVDLANNNYLGFTIKTYEYEKKEKGKNVKKTGYSVEFKDFSEKK